MRRFLCVFLVVCVAASFVSCHKSRPAFDMLSEFISAYGAEGIIYRSDAKEWEDGYIEYDLLKKIYLFYSDFSENFAIFLNSHSDYGSECGVFVCKDGADVEYVSEMCFERIRLLGRGGDNSFVTRSGRVVFYSTMSDGERAREIWHAVDK